MVDLYLDDIIGRNNWEELLKEKLSHLASDSIVRLKLKDKKANFSLTAEQLRNIFPETMNYSLSRSFFTVN